jgi:hypothetical protein
MGTDILNLKYTADEFDNLVKNIENTITEVIHDTSGILSLDISENRNFNILVSADITGLEFVNEPSGLDTYVTISFIQDNLGGNSISLGAIESKDTLSFSTSADTYDIGVFQVRPINSGVTTVCRDFAPGFTAPTSGA